MIGQEVCLAAAKYEGGALFDHFSKIACRGITQAACMERGLGGDELDCSGLVIRAISDVVGRQPADWPRSLRHVAQMQSGLEPQESFLLVERPYNHFGSGDLLFFRFSPRTHDPYDHVAIALGVRHEAKEQIIDAATVGADAGSVMRRSMRWADYKALRACVPAQTLLELA